MPHTLIFNKEHTIVKFNNIHQLYDNPSICIKVKARIAEDKLQTDKLKVINIFQLSLEGIKKFMDHFKLLADITIPI